MIEIVLEEIEELKESIDKLTKELKQVKGMVSIIYNIIKSNVRGKPK